MKWYVHVDGKSFLREDADDILGWLYFAALVH
jgi:hypothetical protein